MFSRVFAKFAEAGLPQQIHEALIKKSCSGTISRHLSRDATAIEAREKPAKKEIPVEVETPPTKKKGRPKKGETPLAKEPTRIQKQLSMTLGERLKDLPTVCKFTIEYKEFLVKRVQNFSCNFPDLESFLAIRSLSSL